MTQLIHVPAYLEGIGTSGTETVDRVKGLAIKRTGFGVLGPVALQAFDTRLLRPRYLDASEFYRPKVVHMDSLLRRIERLPWMAHYDVVRSLNSVEDGCLGIPIVGAYVHKVNYSAMIRVARAKVSAVQSRGVHLKLHDEHNSKQHRVDIYMIAAICGGHWGMVLPRAAAFKSGSFGGIPVQVHLILYLPSCYQHAPEDTQARIQAVGWASLRTLYTYLRGEEYETVLRGRKIRVSKFIDSVWLVSAVNEAGVGLDTAAGEHFDMTAEFLWQIVTSGLGRHIEAEGGEARLMRGRIGSFGVHKLYFPAAGFGQINKHDRAIAELNRLLKGWEVTK
jgi:hypothetical protein